MKYLPTIGTSLSGKLGGIVASRSTHGAYFRSRVNPVNPNTTRQQRVRTAFASAVTAWMSLSDAQRDVWDNYGANVPTVDRIGQSINLAGQSWFIGSYTLALDAGLTPVLDGPTIFNRGDEDPTIAFDVTVATQTVDVAFDTNLDWVGEDDAAMLIFMSRPVSPSINFFKGPYQLAGVILGDQASPPTSPDTLSLPFACVAGNKLFGRAVILRADGRYTSPFRGEDIAA